MELLINIPFSSEPIHINVEEDDTAEEVIINICKYHKIGPLARFLFALRRTTTGNWLHWSRKISEEETKEFDFFLRYNVADTDQLEKMDVNAFDFYFKQARFSVLGDKVSGSVYDEHKSDIMGLSIIDMFRATIEDGLTREEVLHDYKRFVPDIALKKHKIFLKAPVRETFDEIRVKNANPNFCKKGYLEQFRRIFTDYLKEVYDCIVNNDSNENMREITLRVNPFNPECPGISIKYENEETVKF